MDDDGYVNIVGRIKDMVIRGGENIYPREIEEFLLHAIPPSAGRPGDRRARTTKYGEELMALDHAEARRGAAGRGEPGASSASGQLAHYKIPRYVEVVRELSR